MSNHETKVQANHLEIEKSCMKNYDELTEKDLRIQRLLLTRFNH